MISIMFGVKVDRRTRGAAGYRIEELVRLT